MFAGARDRVRADHIEMDIQLPVTVAELKLKLEESNSDLHAFLQHGRIAIQNEFVDDSFLLDLESSQTAIALIPPVSGG